MGIVSIGPLAIPNGVFAGLLAFLTFTILTAVARRRVDERLERWSTVALVVGLITARIVHVAIHWDTFSASPLRALMLWQGGFAWIPGVLAAAASILYIRRSWPARGVAIAILAASVLVWTTAGTVLNDTNGGVKLPDITLTDANNGDVALRRYASGPAVVNLWATWCPPCRRELPAMQAQAAASPGVPFVFVNQAEDPAIVHAYLQEQSLSLEHVLFDAHSELARAIHTAGIPITLFFYDGVMMDLHAGEISPEALRQKTEALSKKNKPQ